MNYKRPYHKKRGGLRIIPLSERIRRELMMEPGTSSSEDKRRYNYSGIDPKYPDSLVELIRFEVQKCIRELKLSEVFVRKTELPQILRSQNIEDLIDDDKCTDNETDLGDKEQEALQMLDNAILTTDHELDNVSNLDSEERTELNMIFNRSKSMKSTQPEGDSTDCQTNGDGNMKSSVQIMFTMTNSNFNDSENSPPSDQEFSKSDGQSHRPYSSVIMKSMESRIRLLEMKISTLCNVIQKIQLVLKRDGGMSPNSQRKLRGIKKSLEMRIEGKLNDIENKVRQSLYEEDSAQDDNAKRKIDPYDELFYEWREYKMNKLHYKKSLRTICLNQRPRLQMSLAPPIVYKFDGSKGNIKPPVGFIETPSRLQVN